MTQIGNVYAQGLYALAKDESLTKLILDQMQVLEKSFVQEPDFLRLLSSPNLPKEGRCEILDKSFRGNVHPYVLNFLKILTEKGYIRHFSDCVSSFKAQYNEDNDILPVDVVSAVALTAEQKDRLTQKLSKLTGKIIELSNKIEPDCLGGIRLDYDGKQIDGTVRNRLDEIRNLLKNTVL